MNKFLIAVALLTLCAVIPMRADETKTEVQERLETATTTLRDLAATPDKGIPDEVYKGAKCIAVVPRMIKGGFIVGGKHGRGVTTCRLPDGSWSAPAFFTISGGSWGLQAGVEDIDLVMMIMNDEGASATSCKISFRSALRLPARRGQSAGTPRRGSIGSWQRRF